MPSDPPIDPVAARALGVILRRRRDEAHLTQEQVAEQAGISRNHYQLLECALSDRARNTPANPRLSTLMALSQVYGVKVSDLVVDIVRLTNGPAVEYEPGTRASASRGSESSPWHTNPRA